MRTLQINGVEITPNGPVCAGYEVELIKQLTDGTIVIGYLAQDEDCPNPCTDCDGMGHIRSLSHRHINSIDGDEAVEMLNSDKMVVALSYFQHGLCRWSVSGDRGNCPDWRWDGVDFAGVWVPDDCCRDEIESRSHRKHISYQAAAQELAKECCDEYTAWANGECYGVVTERFTDEGKFISQDACFGFIGSEYAQKELQNQFDGEKAGELATACAI